MCPPDEMPWSDPSTHPAEWRERTRVVAAFIPYNASVVEIGARRRDLLDVLPMKDYWPIDTSLAALPAFWPWDIEPYDYCVMCGVWEYVTNVAEAAAFVRKVSCTVVMTYQPCPDGGEEERKKRHPEWLNHQTDKAFEKTWRNAGATSVVRLGAWRKQIVWGIS